MDKKLFIIDYFNHFATINPQVSFRAFNTYVLGKLRHIKFTWDEYIWHQTHFKSLHGII
jgi:hypothetical protein